MSRQTTGDRLQATGPSGRSQLLSFEQRTTNNEQRLQRRAFTLVELLITISIIALMASMILFAFYAAQEMAREQKTKSLIARLDAVIKNKWDSYRTRRVQLPPMIDEPWNDVNNNGVFDGADTWDVATQDLNGNNIRDFYPVALRNKVRLDAMRDLQRLELPDRWMDVIIQPANAAIPVPGITQRILAKYNAAQTADPNTPSGANASAELLYLIVMGCISEDGDARDVFRPDDVRDTDGDGFPEFVDAWGTPIKFIRWPAGFHSELQVSARGVVQNVMPGPDSQTILIQAVSDPFDAIEPAGTFDSATGSYVGGAILIETPARLNSSAIITGYSWQPAGVMFTCKVLPSGAIPFNGAPPQQGDKFIVMPADPLDYAGVITGSLQAYPFYPGTGTGVVPQTAPFATYPLIYSAGPDKCFGICADYDDTSPLQYVTSYGGRYWVTPFIVATENITPAPYTGQIGGPRDDDKEKNYVKNGWVDNIHNHLMGLR